MELNNENYYSREADHEFMSVSLYKSIAGSYGRPGCEFAAVEKLEGRWTEDSITAMLVGSYVDRWFEGTLDEFKKETPDLFTKTSIKRYPEDPGKWELAAPFKDAEGIIERVKRDRFFMDAMSGEKQTIMTGEVCGEPWKIKMDSYIPGLAIVDLKVVSSIRDAKWVKDCGYMDFVRYWGYDIQGAIYQEVVRQNTGERLPFYIAAVSKEKEPDLWVIKVGQKHLDSAMEVVKYSFPRVRQVWKGEVEPERCECCECCRHTRVLTNYIELEDLIPGVG